MVFVVILFFIFFLELKIKNLFWKDNLYNYLDVDIECIYMYFFNLVFVLDFNEIKFLIYLLCDNIISKIFKIVL